MTVRGQEARMRASDADRDAALSSLREAYANGRLTNQTLVDRIDAVLRARTHDDLGASLDDLAPSRRPRRFLTVVAGASRVARGVRRAWEAPWLPPFVLPRAARERTIGRSGACDLVLRHESVSRSHAVLRPRQGGWELCDLASMNGTRVNGWRLTGPEVVRPGDVVTFGTLSLRVVDGGAATADGH